MAENLGHTALMMAGQLHADSLASGLAHIEAGEWAQARESFATMKVMHVVLEALTQTHLDASISATPEGTGGPADFTPLRVEEGTAGLRDADPEAANLVDSLAPPPPSIKGPLENEDESMKVDGNEAHHPVLMNEPPSR